MLAPTPGSPLRDTSFRCRQPCSLPAGSGSGKFELHPAAACRLGCGPWAGTGRSLRIRYSNAHSSDRPSWRRPVFEWLANHNHAAPESFSAGYQGRYWRCIPLMQPDQNKISFCTDFRHLSLLYVGGAGDGGPTSETPPSCRGASPHGRMLRTCAAALIIGTAGTKTAARSGGFWAQSGPDPRAYAAPKAGKKQADGERRWSRRGGSAMH